MRNFTLVDANENTFHPLVPLTNILTIPHHKKHLAKFTPHYWISIPLEIPLICMSGLSRSYLSLAHLQVLTFCCFGLCVLHKTSLIFYYISLHLNSKIVHAVFKKMLFGGMPQVTGLENKYAWSCHTKCLILVVGTARISSWYHR